MNKKSKKLSAFLLALALALPTAALADGEPETPDAPTGAIFEAQTAAPEPDPAAPEEELPAEGTGEVPALPEEDEAREDAAEEAALDGDGYYTINGVTVTRTSSSITNNCFTYALEIYRKIWGTGFSSDPASSDNMLRGVTSLEARRLTAENVKNYISAAAPGAVIRLTGSAYVFGTSDAVGHSQLLVQKDASGFTVLESNVTGGSREKYYTWSGYVSWWQQTANRDYFKYIKWPGASGYDGPVPQEPEDECRCTGDYAGDYVCITSTSNLTIRSGHGTSFSAVGSIPPGQVAHVTMADGTWAHVEYNGVSGYASMRYLAPVAPVDDFPMDQDGDGWVNQKDAAIYLGRGKPYLAALSLQLAVTMYYPGV